MAAAPAFDPGMEESVFADSPLPRHIGSIAMTSTIPNAWMPAANMSRIHVHWTAGGYRANATDRNAYHILIEGDGKLVRGERSIKANEAGSGLKQASHTRNANTGAIGVSMCCMAGAREQPFDAGNSPMKREQWDTMVAAVASLTRRYGIPVTPKTILTHAEVEPHLGIRQNGKWDITRLAFDESVRGRAMAGDRMRLEIAVALDAAEREPVPSGRSLPDDMKPPRYRVAGVRPSRLNFRDAPNGVKKGTLPENTVVEKLSESGDWWRVRTLGGFIGWVYSSFLEPA